MRVGTGLASRAPLQVCALPLGFTASAGTLQVLLARQPHLIKSRLRGARVDIPREGTRLSLTPGPANTCPGMDAVAGLSSGHWSA